MRIRFLGTGGGRFVTSYQVRRTGGILIEDKVLIHIDPGPGAARSLREFGEDVRRLDIVAVSHAHPDHITDAPVIVEGMTWGGTKKRGTVIGPETVIDGFEGYRPLSPYHLDLPGRVIKVRSGDKVGDIEVIGAQHTEPRTVGFVIRGARTVTYYSDTGYWEGMERFAGDIVIFNLEVTRDLPTHTSPNVVRRVLERSSPKLVFLTHFGMSMLKYGPERVAKEIESEFGVDVVAARDGYEWRPGRERTLFEF